MRPISFALAALVVSAPTAALSWEEYPYPDYGFALAFPAAPQVQTSTYQLGGRSVPARVYSARGNNVLFTMTVADHSGTNLDEAAIIDQSIKTMAGASGKVEVNIPQRIYRVYGRALTIHGADGSHSMAMVFDYKGRLYQLEGKALSNASDDAQFEAIRFQQSLTFTDGGSNRTEAQIKAIREGCAGLRGAVNAGGNPVNPAGLDDPRCTEGGGTAAE